MKRLLLLVLVAGFVAPAHANAAVPCRNTVVNDWYADGKIATTYPHSCYVDALRHIPADADVYSSLRDDIRSAMSAAARHSSAKQVGGGFKASDGGAVLATQTTKSRGATGPKTAAGPVDTAPQATDATAAPAVADSGGGLPLPILVLGGLALALAAAGAIGGGVKYARERRR